MFHGFFISNITDVYNSHYGDFVSEDKISRIKFSN